MHPREFENLVRVAAHYGASLRADEQLRRKVQAMTGTGATLRLIAAATLYHCWLLRGRPEKEGWRYLARVQYARDLMRHFMTLPVRERRCPSYAPPTKGLEQKPVTPLN
jgi:hypothetical protein